MINARLNIEITVLEFAGQDRQVKVKRLAQNYSVIEKITYD